MNTNRYAPPRSSVGRQVVEPNWASTAILATLWSAVFFFVFAHVGDALSTWLIDFLRPVIQAVRQELGRESARGLGYSISFLACTAITFLFLLPLRFMVRTTRESLAAGFMCITPVTALMLFVNTGNADPHAWSIVGQPLAGFAIFAMTSLRSRPQRSDGKHT